MNCILDKTSGNQRIKIFMIRFYFVSQEVMAHTFSNALHFWSDLIRNLIFAHIHAHIYEHMYMQACVCTHNTFNKKPTLL